MGFQPNISSDRISSGYEQVINNQKEIIADKAVEVKGNLKNADAEAEIQRDNAYENYKYATGIFNTSSFDKSKLEQELQDIQNELKIALYNAREKAEKEGKSQDEIDKICNGIQANYSNTIASLQYSISKSVQSNNLTKTDFTNAQGEYREARFNKIFASNNYISGLFDLAREYHNLGKMQQFQAFMESQTGFDRLG